MDESSATLPKPRRRNIRKASVIEVAPGVPTPVVESEPVAHAPSVETTEPVAPQAVAPAIVEPALTEPEPVTEVTPEPTAAQPAAAPAEPETPVAAIEPAAPPAADPADLATKDVTMDTVETMDTAATKSQAMFGDMNERAKGAMERSAKVMEEIAQFNKGNLDALVESGRIAARGFESLGQDAAAFAKQSFEQSSAAMRQFASVKSPTEFMKLQSDLFRQSFDQMVAQSSRQAETMLKLAGEVAQPLSNRVAVAVEKAKVTA